MAAIGDQSFINGQGLSVHQSVLMSLAGSFFWQIRAYAIFEQST